ncbi:hypothetical protein FH972_023163 [Carpinus fangiana]|uniref:Methyltransferase type 11 domain-containing protein n=1 Tax=Carpinus fangiana TaxID=176857 RepID=A0A5N6KWN5_9ROSI|nr:hypothetical protein FH972_023163 [Carpinus fangiana]
MGQGWRAVAEERKRRQRCWLVFLAPAAAAAGSSHVAFRSSCHPQRLPRALSSSVTAAVPARLFALRTACRLKIMSRQIDYLPNVEAYDKWAASYDSDGNILQAIDTLALQTSLFPALLKHIAPPFALATGQANPDPLRIIDLGCGTGRATLTLLGALSSQSPQPQDGSMVCQAAARDLIRQMGFNHTRAQTLRSSTPTVHIIGLDASPGMLSVAQRRVAPHTFLANLGLAVTVEFREYDVRSSTLDIQPVQAAVSTLVMEHLELPLFFAQLSKCILPGGFAVVTNMHSDMGRVPPTMAMVAAASESAGPPSARQALAPTGAGFLDPVTGNKIRAAVDYVHTIPDVLAAARHAGFEIAPGTEVEQIKVEDWMFERRFVGSFEKQGPPLLGQRGRKWMGINVWFGIVLRRVDPLTQDSTVRV